VGGLRRPEALWSSTASEPSAGSFISASRWRKREQRSQGTCFLTTSAGTWPTPLSLPDHRQEPVTQPHFNAEGLADVLGGRIPATQLCHERGGAHESLMDSCHPHDA